MKRQSRSCKPNIEGLEDRELLSTCAINPVVAAHVQTVNLNQNFYTTTKQRVDTAFNDAMSVLSLRFWADLQTGKTTAAVSVGQKESQMTLEYTNTISALQQIEPLKAGVLLSAINKTDFEACPSLSAWQSCQVTVQKFFATSKSVLDTASLNEKRFVISMNKLTTNYTRAMNMLNPQLDKAIQAGNTTNADIVRQEIRQVTYKCNLAIVAMDQKFGLGDTKVHLPAATQTIPVDVLAGNFKLWE